MINDNIYKSTSLTISGGAVEILWKQTPSGILGVAWTSSGRQCTASAPSNLGPQKSPLLCQGTARFAEWLPPLHIFCLSIGSLPGKQGYFCFMMWGRKAVGIEREQRMVAEFITSAQGSLKSLLAPSKFSWGSHYLCLTSVATKAAKTDPGRLSRFCAFYTTSSFSTEVNWKLTVIALCELAVLNMILWPADLMYLFPGLSLFQGYIKNHEAFQSEIIGVKFCFCITLKASGRVAWVSITCIILISVDSHKCKAGLD